jgi:hypothetical protein
MEAHDTLTPHGRGSVETSWENPWLKEHDEVRLRWREQIERGWQEAQAGRVVDGPAAMARLKQRVTARSKKPR